METHLRPLSLGEILDRTAHLYRSHFWLFAGIACVNSGAILLLNLVQIGAQEFLHVERQMRSLVLLSGLGAMLQLLVWFLVGGIAVAANNRAVAWLHLGEPATIRGAYGSILPRAGRYAWLMVIITFLLWTPLALLYGGSLSLLFFTNRPAAKAATHIAHRGPMPDQRAAFVLGELLFGVLFVVCLVYALLMFLRYSLAIAASVVEGLKARQAIRRSVELSKGSRGRIFLLLLLVIIIYFGFVGVTQLVFIVMAFRHGQLPVGARVAQQLVVFVTDTFLGPIYAIGLTLFYYDQRVRKEGYDIEWMMQAAGLLQAAAPAQADGLTALAELPAQAGPTEPTAQPDHAGHA
jgi:hypothetical protein